MEKYHIVDLYDDYSADPGYYDPMVYRAKEADKEIVKLKTEKDALLSQIPRWRKFSEEKPKEKQWIWVFVENPSKYGAYTELRRWDCECKYDVEVQELYTRWMPQPLAPKKDE